MEKKFYVYKHETLDTGEIFYVGKGHKNRAYSSYKRNKLWHNIVKKHGIKVTILRFNLSAEESFLLESSIITEFKAVGLCRANMTLGGEGTIGYKHTDECKKVMSFKKKGKPLSKLHKINVGLASKGKTRSKEFSNKVALGKGTKKFNVFKSIKTGRGNYLKGEFVCSFINQHEAERVLNVSGSNINNCLKGLRPQAKGFIFQYEEVG